MNHPDYTPLVRCLLPLLERELRRVRRARYRARKMGNDATLTIHQWLHILRQYKWRCALCGGPFETIEHLTPIAHGGGTNAQNCVPCCVQCNAKRNEAYTNTSNILLAVAQASAPDPVTQDIQSLFFRSLSEYVQTK